MGIGGRPTAAQSKVDPSLGAAVYQPAQMTMHSHRVRLPHSFISHRLKGDQERSEGGHTGRHPLRHPSPSVLPGPRGGSCPHPRAPKASRSTRRQHTIRKSSHEHQQHATFVQDLHLDKRLLSPGGAAVPQPGTHGLSEGCQGLLVGLVPTGKQSHSSHH